MDFQFITTLIIALMLLASAYAQVRSYRLLNAYAAEIKKREVRLGLREIMYDHLEAMPRLETLSQERLQ